MPSLVGVLQIVAGLRAEFTFNVDAVVLLDFGAQFLGNEMHGVAVHRIALDGIHGARLGACPFLQSPLEQSDDGGLSSPDRAHQQENPLPHLQALGRRLEVLDQLFNRLINAEKLLAEKVVARDLISRAWIDDRRASSQNHVADAGMCQLRELRPLDRHFKVLTERPFPVQRSTITPVCFQKLGNIGL